MGNGYRSYDFTFTDNYLGLDCDVETIVTLESDGSYEVDICNVCLKGTTVVVELNDAYVQVPNYITYRGNIYRPILDVIKVDAINAFFNEGVQ